LKIELNKVQELKFENSGADMLRKIMLLNPILKGSQRIFNEKIPSNFGNSENIHQNTIKYPKNLFD
jgi:hypothetical protein